MCKCKGKNYNLLTFYKRYWLFCRDCGTAESIEKKNYKLSFLPFKDYKKNTDINDSNIYDYFTDKAHIEDSILEGEEFYNQYIYPYGIDISSKRILDISGGNGHAIMALAKRGAKVEITEFNKRAVDYSTNFHKINAYLYDLNKDELSKIVKGKYDVITLRACIMFAKDLSSLSHTLFNILNPGGYLIINKSVKPTLGVFTRTQLDQHSYFFLRQPETIEKEFAKVGFKTIKIINEVDPTMYVYDNDLTLRWYFLHYFYELRNSFILRKNDAFEIRSRDRRRSTLILQK